MRMANTYILDMVASHGISYPTPNNLSYHWGYGSMAGFLLMWQMVSGVLLAMHYTPDVTIAFNSVESIMSNVKHGWLIRYCHSGGASMFFIMVYVHISRALYFSSYRKDTLWYSGIVMLLLMMATAFLGYVLPWGQMSLWGATVIVNLFGAFPMVGQYIVDWLWGGYSVSNPTLKSFFVLHFVLPFGLVGISLLHIALLHMSGSTTTLGTCNQSDNSRFYPKFMVKDIFGFFLVVGFLSLFTVFWHPNFLGHPDNYIENVLLLVIFSVVFKSVVMSF